MTSISTVGGARLPSHPHPRMDALFRVAERVYDARPDVRQRIPDVRSWEFWFWFSWFTRDEQPETQAAFPPLPPEFLIHRVVGESATSRSFVDSGLWDWRRMTLSFQEAGFDLERGGPLLDFGCGCGRILRHFVRYSHARAVSGADVDEGAVAWCRENLPFATYEVLPKAPPSPFAPGTFDAVFAYSVFSHLPEKLHRAWIEDLHRITRPGAIVVLTVQGMRVIEKMIERKLPSDRPSAAELSRDLPRIRESGFAFYPYGHLGYTDERNQQFYDRWDMETYGSTFMLHTFFHRRWSDLFHVVSWNPAPDDWQDYVILRRLPGP